MTVKDCFRDGMYGFKWGDNGSCHIYREGSRESMAEAIKLAEEDGKKLEAKKEAVFKPKRIYINNEVKGKK